MAKKITYKSNDKTFHVHLSSKRIRKSIKFGFFLVASIIFVVLFAFFILKLISTSNSVSVVTFNEKGTETYRVYLKENDDYKSDYLGEDMEYISSLIDYVQFDYNYQLHSKNELTMDYNYKITADLIIANKEANGKYLYKDTYELEKGSKKITDKQLMISDSVEIDYDKFNKISEDIKKEHGLYADSYLEVKFEMINDSTSNDVDNSLKTTNSLLATIPLNEITIAISTASNTFDESRTISRKNLEELINLYMILAGASFLLAVVNASLATYVYQKYYSKKDIYLATVKKYLREYDRLIVSSKQPAINEKHFENKIRVMSIEELIDAHDSSGAPIIYYEVEPNEKSYFVIIDNTTLYKLTISRTWLENNKKDPIV